MEKLFYNTIESPIGYLKLTSDIDHLLSVTFVDRLHNYSEFQPEILQNTALQLKEYFAGERKDFYLNINPSGTIFQKLVWKYVSKIPYGKTSSYLNIAIQSGSNKNTRAVGLANGKNPIPIIIPCHRVIGTNGKLTGYAGGIDKKRWLLHHEMQFSNLSNLLF